MQLLETVIGVVAAMLTSPLYISQVKKVRACQPTEDLSSRTLIALTSGLVLWVVYGAVKADWIIIAASVAETASLDLSSTTSYAGSLARPSRAESRLTIERAGEKHSRRSLFCNSVLIPVGRFRT